ncbi:hypothetical protein [Wuhan house centipede virus 1]|uniref:hypothetical protein n=1 Tax=Wuhan house centipede virus 1 TaxID=1923705 RepID=UPI0009096CE8|nr:hypothetical protein [Wuhan house centipede virus 1]APG77530.1 hypothetical protein 3 [Wuhan house centipede virus 1]APG77723.1 hypothetical protein [Wuhan house centipede virus 1]APG77768.1 hypothetical protein [Wuhan house centipede virus 1]APG77797.1 hypothetical protein [Wuhan house centipede virus 1]BBV14743.1 hypothetical protein 2 [Wuhan house centipede virus 1]
MSSAVRNRSRIPVVSQRTVQRPRVVTRTRVVVPRQKTRNTPRSNYFDLNKVFTDISSTFTRALSNPLVLCTISIALGVILTHDFEKKNGYIYDTFKERNDNISQWIVNNGKKFAGLLIFAPAVVDAPRNLRAVVALVSFLWVMIIPESKAAEYFLQSLALHTYFRLSNNNSKLMVLFMVVIAWFLGFLTVGKNSS